MCTETKEHGKIDGENITKYPNGSFMYDDEEKNCIFFHNCDGTGCINYCVGNAPYSCHRAKKEGLCHHVKGGEVKVKRS